MEPGRRLKLSARLSCKESKGEEGKIEINLCLTVKLASHGNPGSVDPCKPDISLTLVPANWKPFLVNVFLRGNFTGGKKESTPSIIEEGVCRELDRITKSNGILAWSQLYNHNHCQERQ